LRVYPKTLVPPGGEPGFINEDLSSAINMCLSVKFPALEKEGTDLRIPESRESKSGVVGWIW